MATRGAGSMGEHSPVPLWSCRGPRSDDQRRTVPTSSRSASRRFAFSTVLLLPEMEVAIKGSDRESEAAVPTPEFVLRPDMTPRAITEAILGRSK